MLNINFNISLVNSENSLLKLGLKLFDLSLQMLVLKLNLAELSLYRLDLVENKFLIFELKLQLIHFAL